MPDNESFFWKFGMSVASEPLNRQLISSPSGAAILGRGWVLFLLLLLLFLGQFFFLILHDAAQDDLQARNRQNFHRADRILTNVEREIPPLAAWNAQVKRLLRDTVCEQWNDRQIQFLESRIRQRLHSTVQLLWFSPDGRVMNPGAAGFGGGQTVWQAFWKVLQEHPEVTTRERSLARNLVLTYMGRIMPFEMLSSAIDAVISLIFHTDSHYFSLLRFRDGAGKIVGSCFLLQPLAPLPPDWSIRRAVRRQSRKEYQVGAWRFSRQEEIAPSPLDPNLLPGLAEKLQNGRNMLYIGGDLYLARISDTDPDLMLAVRLVEVAPSGVLEKGLRAGRLGLMLVAGVLGALLLNSRWRPATPALSLRSKLILGGSLLVLPPVLAMLIFGYSQARLMKDAGLRFSESYLEQRLHTIETAYVDAMFAWQNALTQLMKQDFVIRGEEQPIREYLLKLFPWKDFRYYLFHINGRRFSFSTSADYPEKEEHLRYIATLLKSADFEIPLDGLTGSSTGALTNIMSGFEMPEYKWEDIVGRLAPTEMGSADWLTFPAFAVDASGRKVAFIFFGLRRFSARQAFLQEQQKVLVPGVEVMIQGLTGIPTRAAELLERANSTGQPQFAVVGSKGTEQAWLARQLRGLDVGAVATMSRERQSPYWAYSQFLALAVLMALLTSLWAVHFLQRNLYEPVIEIGRAIPAIEAGKFGYQNSICTGDELQSLAQGVEELGKGLEQKARLHSFVRPDLVTTMSARQAEVRRVHLTVLFAGLRQFGALESRLTPEEALETMGAFLGRVEQSVMTHGGQIDKFIGDTAMAVFLPHPEGAGVEERAVAAAVALHDAFDVWNQERRQKNQPCLIAGVGLASGETLTGSIGSRRRRLDFTAIGDVVNLAARLEKLGGRDQHPMIIGTGAVCGIKHPGWFWKATGIRGVRGRSEETPAYGLVKEEPPS